jgi:hypothetical protein
MITAQWARGRRGRLYKYYRCARKHGTCWEKYTQEKYVTQQCVAFLKPLALSESEAKYAREIIDHEVQKSSQEVEATLSMLDEQFSGVQAKLNKLTRSYIDEFIDLESYNATKAALVFEKTHLKAEKERLRKTHNLSWIEPSREVISALEMAAKQQVEQSPEELSLLIHNVGLNPRISQRRVTASYAPPYDFTARLLADPARERGDTFERSSISPITCSLMCSLVYHLRSFCRSSNRHPDFCVGEDLN